MSIRSNFNFKTLAISSLALASFIAAPSSIAGTTCEKGKIRALSTDDGNQTRATVTTGISTTAGLNKRKMFDLWGTTIFADNEAQKSRWDEKYTALKMAYATDSYIYLWSQDNDCAGPPNEFWIVVCPSAEDCGG